MGSLGAMEQGSKDRYQQAGVESKNSFRKELKEEFPIRASLT